ncbi:hypothetical protein DFS34DRAFT_108402 [Phlyctochytrium arcticum]|nr:hypothetical protein DFS34DRAFT_108402 [Phlyctochytrium arcticum]
MELQNPPVFAYNQDGGALKPFAINTIFRDDSVHSVLDSHSSHLVDPLRPIKIPKCFGGDVISAIGDAEDGNSISSRILWQDTYLSTFAKPYRGPSKLPADGKLVKQTRSSKLTCYTLPPPNLHHEYELNPLFKRWVNSHSFYGQTGPSFIIPQQEARQPPQLQSQKSAPSTPSTSPRINAKSQERVSSYMDMDVDEDGYEAEEDWSATPKRSKPSQSRPPTLSQSLSMMITPSQESLIHLASSSSQSQSQSQSTQLATPSQLSQPGLSLSQPSPSMFFSQSQRTPKGPSSHKKKKYTPGGKRRVKGF